MTERERLDPPPAAPLTAEGIAESVATLRDTAAHMDFVMGERASISLAITAVCDSHAALRDRLARAEEWCVVLEGTLEDAHSTLYALSQMTHNWANMGTVEEYKAMVDVSVVRASRMRKRIHAVLAAPTDGAARAGDAAGEGGGAA